MGYAEVPNDTHNYIIFFKITLINPNSVRKVYILSSYKVLRGGYEFPKILIFCLKAWILSLAISTVSCFAWSYNLTWFIFKKMSAKCPVWISMAYLSVIQVKFPQKNMGSLAHNPNSSTGTFPKITVVLRAIPTEMFWYSSHSVTRSAKNIYLMVKI